MKAEQKEKWEKTRQKGQFRFILTKTIFFGLVGTFFYILLVDYALDLLFSDAPIYLHESETFLTEILLCLIIHAFAGLFVAYNVWEENEDEFFRLQEVQ